MTKVLFIFMDGIGLGVDDPETNPLARADMPFVRSLLGGQRLIASTAPFESDKVSLLALDAELGVEGRPQSATGQAVLLTGINIPAELGYHYGPKPNASVREFLKDGRTLFSWLRAKNKTSALLNAFPPRYFSGIQSGKRIYSSIPQAVTNAGISLFSHEDFLAGRAMSADFTGQGWRDMLGFPEAPLRSPYQAGVLMAGLASGYDFSMFEYWPSDYAGHKQDMDWAVRQMETFDLVLNGLLDTWDPDQGLILVTSDHGNMEDLSTRRHTDVNVPGLLIGSQSARDAFTAGLTDLTHIAPRIASAVLG